MKTKRLKAPAIETEAEFRLALTGIIELQNKAASLAAIRDGDVLRIQKHYAAQIEPIDALIKAKLGLVEKYADANRAALLPKDRKSADTTFAIFGWRTGNPSVKPVSKKIDEATIIAALKANHLAAYVRTVEEIAKDKILADAKHDEQLGAVALVTSLGSRVILAEIGLKIAQSETFYVEPKVETGETVKGGAS